MKLLFTDETCGVCAVYGRLGRPHHIQHVLHKKYKCYYLQLDRAKEGLDLHSMYAFSEPFLVLFSSKMPREVLWAGKF